MNEEITTRHYIWGHMWEHNYKAYIENWDNILKLWFNWWWVAGPSLLGTPALEYCLGKSSCAAFLEVPDQSDFIFSSFPLSHSLFFHSHFQSLWSFLLMIVSLDAIVVFYKWGKLFLLKIILMCAVLSNSFINIPLPVKILFQIEIPPPEVRQR